MTTLRPLFRWLRLVSAACALVSLTACGTVQMGAPQASLEGIQAVRAAKIEPVAVGHFSPAPGLPRGFDSSVGVRAITLVPSHGSFAGYLQETLEAELSGAGIVDPSAKLSLGGSLTDRRLDPSIGTGHGRLAARFVLKSGESVVYDKEQVVTSSWDSSFIGAVAIPAAINEFTVLFRQLVLALLNDPDFLSAAKDQDK